MDCRFPALYLCSGSNALARTGWGPGDAHPAEKGWKAMKVLVATADTQGRRENDFCWADEGEIVTFGSECDDETIDGTCGCRRALCGVETRRATTTFRVEERDDLSQEDLVAVLAASLVAGRWFATMEQAGPTAVANAFRLARLASLFPEDTVLERRGDQFAARAQWRTFATELSFASRTAAS